MTNRTVLLGAEEPLTPPRLIRALAHVSLKPGEEMASRIVSANTNKEALGQRSKQLGVP